MVWVVPQTPALLDDFYSIECSDIGQRYFSIPGSRWADVLQIAELRQYTQLLRLSSRDVVDRSILRKLAAWQPAEPFAQLTDDDAEVIEDLQLFEISKLPLVLANPDRLPAFSRYPQPGLISSPAFNTVRTIKSVLEPCNTHST